MPTNLRRVSALSALAFATAFAVGCGDDDPTQPIDEESAAVISGNLTTSRTLYADTVYTLRGFVKVANGAVLTIQPGTKIIGDTTVVGSSLFVLRGARIEAAGTAASPIVFTSARAPGSRAPGDWGGLVVVGNATVSRTSVIVEGSDANVPNGGAPGVSYSGGTTDTDNSGTLQFVRVEFAGYGVAQDAELNSFTFASVGSGTTLDHLQALAGLDDSFEWFGGTVDARYLVSYEAADDHFDASEGFRGRVQFLLGLQSTVLQPRPGTGFVASDPQGFEIDGCAGTGCADLQNSTPFNMPLFANFTLIGPGPNVLPPSGGVGMVIRRGSGGVWVNGIVGRWSVGVSVRDATTDARRQADSLNLRNTLLVQNTAHLDPSGANFTQQANFAGSGLDSLASGVTASSVFTNLAPNGTLPSLATLDWSLAAASPARTGGLNPFTGRILARAGSYVVPTSYRGAADPNGTKWWEGWTVYSRN
jgi:hypothetical protein